MPTIRRCCIVGCMSNSRQNPNLQFFQFPRPESPFHKLWKEACHASLRRILPFKKPVVCALHFDPSCLGGRRLTSNAVPTLRLEVPSNLEAVEQEAMIEEIERSRKCAYINAVVYEWLVRANMNSQLRGSITHGMIKEKAESARQIIGSGSFVADNRWLNRFRETHLSGFAQKLANGQLKPLGSSLWIPDIVQDLQHLFPPASAERVAKLDDMPEQYMNYMQQYGEYEEEEEDSKEQSYIEQQTQYQLQQQQHHLAQQQQQQHHHGFNHHPGYDPYAQHPGYNNFGDYYSYERQQQHHQQQQQLHQQQQQHLQQQQFTAPRSNSISPNSQQMQHSPHPQQLTSVAHHRGSPFQQANQQSRSSPFQQPLKRLKLETPDGDEHMDSNGGTNGGNERESTSPIEDLTDENDANQQNSNNVTNGTSSITSKEIAETTKTNGNITPTLHLNGRASTTGTPSPKSTHLNGSGSGTETNGHTSPTNSLAINKELDNYAQALEYLKPLEDFVLFKENFRAIGLLSQLEAVLRKGEKSTLLEH